jgi:hypothetical protein
MAVFCPTAIRRTLPRLDDVSAWIPWVRLIAAPFAVLEVVVERGNYPPGYERWAWIVTGTFVAGALTLFWFRQLRAPGLAFDLVVVSAYVAVYSFELGTPVRQLLFLVAAEAGILYGRLGGALLALATAPALAFFEWKQSDAAGSPYDPGHVLGPVGVALLLGLLVGAFAERRGERL